MYVALHTDLPRYRIATEYLLYFYTAKTDKNVVDVLYFCRLSNSVSIQHFLVRNGDISNGLVDNFSIFNFNKVWLQFSVQLPDIMIEGLAEIHYHKIQKKLNHLF